MALALTSAGGAVAPSDPTHEAAVNDDSLASLAAGLAQACPATVDTSSIVERDVCAARLAEVHILSDAAIRDGIRWGGVSQEDFNPTHNSLTLLNTLVWRKIYGARL